MAVPYTNEEIAQAIANIRNEQTVGGNTKGRIADVLTGLLFKSILTVTPIGQLQVFKAAGNLDNENFEPGDTVIGYVEGQFLNAGTFYGGDPLLLASYSEIEQNLEQQGASR